VNEEKAIRYTVRAREALIRCDELLRTVIRGVTMCLKGGNERSRPVREDYDVVVRLMFLPRLNLHNTRALSGAL
jgi:hypothetical protein